MATTERAKKKVEEKGFVGEMRTVAMKLHTKDQAREGEKEHQGESWRKIQPSVDGYLRFLVDSKVVFGALERIVDQAAHPCYAQFRNTGLERTQALERDLEWFREQGHLIPAPTSIGANYASYLENLTEKDPQAFLCHFYNVYFAHSAGGRMIGRKLVGTFNDNQDQQLQQVAEKLNCKVLEFYKWDGDLPKLLQNVKDEINRIANNWSREEQLRCLQETEKSFEHSMKILRLITV